MVVEPEVDFEYKENSAQPLVVKPPLDIHPQISILKNFLIFILGFAGLDIVGIIAGQLLIAFSGLPAEALPDFVISTPFLSNYNIIRYSVVAIFMAFLLAKDFTKFVPQLKRFMPYFKGLTYGVLLVIVSVSYGLFLDVIGVSSTDNANQTAVINLVKTYPLISAIWIPFLGPIIEELTYRLGLFDGIRKWNKIAAYVAVALVFGLIHFDYTSANLVNELLALPSYVLAGLLLSYVYEKEGIVASSVAHIFNNLFSFIQIVFLIS